VRVVDVCPVDILTFKEDSGQGTGVFKEDTGLAQTLQMLGFMILGIQEIRFGPVVPYRPLG